MPIRFLPVFPLLAIGLSLILTTPLQAQEQIQSQPRTSADTSSPGSDDPKLPIENMLPYSTWKHHVAEKAEEALVPVFYSEEGSEKKSLATGLIVRCDGFVLVPRIVRDTGRLGGTVQVILSKIDGAKRDDKVIASGHNNPYTHETVPYGLIKTNGYHVRCLPMLDSENVTVKKSVRLFWYAAKGNEPPELVSRKATIEATTSTKDIFSLALVAESEGEVPFGAIVIDDESSAALGMVTQGGTHPAFITLARFNVISCDIGLAPDRAAVRLGDHSGSLPSGTAEMVWVPGGPVPLDGKAGKDFIRDYGVAIACTPGVWVAVQPVTNGEYRRWLSKQKQLVMRLPYGWKARELTTPIRREDFPACGMFPNDAGSYAAAHQSRLLTDVEWRRASYTEDTSWVDETNKQWETDAKRLGDLFDQQKRFADAIEAEALLVAQQAFATKGNVLRANARINLVLNSTPEMDALAKEILQFSDSIVHRDSLWGLVMSVDSYPQDRSVFGVRNVLINAPEMVLSRVQGAINLAPKYSPAIMDQYLSGAGVSGVGNGWSLGSNNKNSESNILNEWDSKKISDDMLNTGMEAWRRLQMISIAYIVTSLWRPGGLSLPRGIISTALLFPNDQERQNRGWVFRYQMGAGFNVREGFRCAR